MSTPDQQPANSAAGCGLAVFLLIAYLGITAFPYVVVMPMIELFLLYAAHFPNSLNSWGTVLVGSGLSGIVLLVVSVLSEDRERKFLVGVFAWVALLSSALLLLVITERFLATLTTALPFACLSVAWMDWLGKQWPGQGPNTPSGPRPDPTYAEHFTAEPRKTETEQVTERDGTTDRSP
jgi:hypothetical protein